MALILGIRLVCRVLQVSFPRPPSSFTPSLRTLSSPWSVGSYAISLALAFIRFGSGSGVGSGSVLSLQLARSRPRAVTTSYLLP